MRLRILLRTVAAVALAAAAPALAPAPAQAEACAGETGVTVVVDFTALGGGVATTCVADGGGDSAADLFEVDHALTRVTNYPGAVCRVDGAPADLDCRNMPPEHYYWALYWSDADGTRVYSSQGVDSLEVPDGGSVEFVFHKSAAPESEGPSPSSGGSAGPRGSGSTGSTGGPGGPGGGSTGSTPSGAPSTAPPAVPTGGDTATSAGPKDDQGDRTGKKDGGGKGRSGTSDEGAQASSPVPSDDPSDAVPVSAEPSADGDALPAWVAPVAVLVLFGAAGTVALLRRRTAP